MLLAVGAICVACGLQSASHGGDIFQPPTTETRTFPSFRLRGRIDTDFLWSDQTKENQETFGELSDTVGLRRARIGAEGHFTPDSRYVAEIDLAGGDVVIRDFYAGLGDVSQAGELKFGHMREPFSLEGGTSANSFAFMERAPINTLDPARNWGAGFIQCHPAETWTLAAGLFQSGTDASDVVFRPGCTSAFTARGTGLALYEQEGRRLIHFGAAISERIADQGLIVINQRPSSPLLDLGDSVDSPFVPRLRIVANFQQLANVQWAAVNGPLWAQAEWYGTLIAQRGGGPVFFHGSHLDVGYFLTGEHRSYLTHAGVFGPVAVRRPVLTKFSSKSHAEERGVGAWELTGRISYLDFVDDDSPKDSQGQATGVLLPQATVGVNWYLADRVRLMFNYTGSAPDEVNTGASFASVFGMRLGVFW